MLQPDQESNKRDVDVEKEPGVGLGLTLDTSLFTDRISVTAVKPESLAFDLLSVGDAIDEIDGIKIRNSDEAAALIKAATHVRLTVIPAGTVSRFGPDVADLCNFIALNKKALLAGCCFALLLVALPVQLYAMHVTHVNHGTLEMLQKERDSTKNAILSFGHNNLKKEKEKEALGLALAAQRKSSEEEHRKYAQSLNVQRATYQNETSMKSRAWASELAAERKALAEERLRHAEERKRFAMNLTETKISYEAEVKVSAIGAPGGVSCKRLKLHEQQLH